jgi:hypothetical protein
MTDSASTASRPTEPRPVDEVPPLEEPDTPNTDPDEVKRVPLTGVHVLEKGDTPAGLARRLFGRGSLGRDIVAANPGVQWRPGSKIKLPEVN